MKECQHAKSPHRHASTFETIRNAILAVSPAARLARGFRREHPEHRGDGGAEAHLQELVRLVEDLSAETEPRIDR